MRIENSYRIIPCYTADVSGVCSALFELGGMVVMHDPSGCNSTYNTHDETRWYDHDSLIYITGLTEMDAILGNDQKVVRDVSDAAGRLSPKFIALCGSPIPFINGTDYSALARMIEKETGIPTFAVATNGMHDYVQGAGAALLAYAKKILKPIWDQAPARKETIQSTGQISVNLLGVTPLDFAFSQAVFALKHALATRDIHVLSVFSMLDGENMTSLEAAVYANVNLVVSAAGYPLARFMQEQYGIPFVVGAPFYAFAEILCEDIRKAAAGSCEHCFSYFHRNAWLQDTNCHPSIAIIGEPVTAGSLAAMITKKYQKKASVLCPLEKSGGFLTQDDHCFLGEAQCMDLMKQYHHIIADPLYLPICPEHVAFHRLPHLAFSGRCHLAEMDVWNRLFD